MMAARRYRASGTTAVLPVLCYHDVGNPVAGACPGLTVTPELFERHLQRLSRDGYHTIRITECLEWLQSSTSLPVRSVLLTFDDAYASLTEHAFPLLRRYRMSAIVFVVTRQLGGCNAWDVADGWSRMDLMSADDIRRWASDGIEFGAHTRTHARLTRVDDETLRDEIEGSARDLEELTGARPLALAYPYGAVDGRVRDVAGKSFRLAFTTSEGIVRPGHALSPCELPRAIIYPTDTAFDFHWRLRLGWSPLHRIREHLVIRTRLRELARTLRAPWGFA